MTAPTAPSSGTITHVGVVPVFVTDQQRALEFYRDALGFDVDITSQPASEPWGTWFGFRDPDGNAFVVSEASEA